MGLACVIGLAALAVSAGPTVVCEQAQALRLCRTAPVSEGGLLVVEVEPSFACGAPAVVWEQRWFRTVVRGGRHQVLLPVRLGGIGVYGLEVVCGRATAVFAVPVDAADFPSSELRVAPRFSRPAPPRAAAESRRMQEATAGDRVGRTWRAPFLPPADGRVTAVFGVRRLFNGVLASQHRGLDIDGRVGAPVRAANDGVVTLAANDYFYPGSTVILDHGERLFTVYFHLSRIDVREGQTVRRGQPLGAIGRTGRVTGPHLHFGVKLAGIYVDPQALLAFDPAAPLGGLTAR